MPLASDDPAAPAEPEPAPWRRGLDRAVEVVAVDGDLVGRLLVEDDALPRRAVPPDPRHHRQARASDVGRRGVSDVDVAVAAELQRGPAARARDPPAAHDRAVVVVRRRVQGGRAGAQLQRQIDHRLPDAVGARPVRAALHDALGALVRVVAITGGPQARKVLVDLAVAVVVQPVAQLHSVGDRHARRRKEAGVSEQVAAVRGRRVVVVAVGVGVTALDPSAQVDRDRGYALGARGVAEVDRAAAAVVAVRVDRAALREQVGRVSAAATDTPVQVAGVPVVAVVVVRAAIAGRGRGPAHVGDVVAAADRAGVAVVAVGVGGTAAIRQVEGAAARDRAAAKRAGVGARRGDAGGVGDGPLRREVPNPRAPVEVPGQDPVAAIEDRVGTGPRATPVARVGVVEVGVDQLHAVVVHEGPLTVVHQLVDQVLLVVSKLEVRRGVGGGQRVRELEVEDASGQEAAVDPGVAVGDHEGLARVELDRAARRRGARGRDRLGLPVDHQRPAGQVDHRAAVGAHQLDVLRVVVREGAGLGLQLVDHHPGGRRELAVAWIGLVHARKEHAAVGGGWVGVVAVGVDQAAAFVLDVAGDAHAGGLSSAQIAAVVGTRVAVGAVGVPSAAAALRWPIAAVGHGLRSGGSGVADAWHARLVRQIAVRVDVAAVRLGGQLVLAPVRGGVARVDRAGVGVDAVRVGLAALGDRLVVTLERARGARVDRTGVPVLAIGVRQTADAAVVGALPPCWTLEGGVAAGTGHASQQPEAAGPVDARLQRTERGVDAVDRVLAWRRGADVAVVPGLFGLELRASGAVVEAHREVVLAQREGGHRGARVVALHGEVAVDVDADQVPAGLQGDPADLPAHRQLVASVDRDEGGGGLGDNDRRA